jgi:metallo-beta-lactamase class B
MARVRFGLSRISALACDVLRTPHPSAGRLLERLSGAAPLLDAEACRRYAQGAETSFDERLTKERSAQR